MLKKKKGQNGTVQVTFELPNDGSIESVYLVGDFNDWDEHAALMGQQNGGFSITLNLQKDSEYQFRYLVNGAQWQNDSGADKYLPNSYGDENSVVTT